MRRQKDAVSKTILLGLAMVFIFPVLLFAGEDFIKDNFLKPAYNAAGAIPYIGNTLQGGMKTSYNTVYNAGYSFGSWAQPQLSSLQTSINNFKMPQIGFGATVGGISTWASKINIGQSLSGLGTWLQNIKPQFNTQSWLKFDFLGGQKLGTQAVQTNINDVAAAQGLKSITTVKPLSTSGNLTPLKDPTKQF